MLAEWPYRAALALYELGITIAAERSTKAAQWLKGRQQQNLTELDIPKNGIWVHCASLGEYEQGRSVIEALQESYPDKPIILSFFSPSGYEVLKKRGTFQHLLYLPLDSPQHATEFINTISPSLAIFVKYEYWYYYLRELNRQRIPTILISAIFSSSSVHFKPWGILHKQMLKWFDRIFVQNELSKKLLAPYTEKVTVAGDTRFDRVLQLKEHPKYFPDIEAFASKQTTLVAGSTWPDDDLMICEHFLENRGQFRLIVAPHEISENYINLLAEGFKHSCILYSNVDKEIPEDVDVLIIDSIGILSHLYKYGTLAYIGGGFGAGIHNTLEAAANGMPVVFGPKHSKFQEAVDLIKQEAAFSVSSYKEYEQVMQQLLNDRIKLDRTSKAADNYVRSKTGATDIILKYINKALIS